MEEESNPGSWHFLKRLVTRSALSSALLLITALPVQAQLYATDPVSGLPLLNSNTNSPGALFIDFDGATVHQESGTFGAYGGDNTFDTAEQQQIYETWRDVSAHFAMFDINVTTVAPDKTTTPTGHLVISPDFVNAWAYVNTFGRTASTAFGGVESGSNWLEGRSTVVTHEFGHILGLYHQDAYDNGGNFLYEYRRADSFGRAPLMGSDFRGSQYASWQDGFTGTSMTAQDDISIIINTLISEYGTSYTAAGGDGFRVDEHGDTTGVATALSLTGSGSVTSEAEGIIERYSDVDMFELVWSGGDLTMTAEAQRHLDADQTYASSLGMTLQLLDDQGGTIVQDGSVNVADVDAVLSVTDLAAGTYYFAVSSNQDYEDLGAYTLSLSGTEVPEPTSMAMLAFAALLLFRRRRA